MTYLQKKLVSSNVAIKQPSRGFFLTMYRLILIISLSAIMQGAVLHGLGYNLVKERIIRRSYGVITSPEFVHGQHPENRRFQDESGKTRCRDVMEWFACKVSLHSNSSINAG